MRFEKLLTKSERGEIPEQTICKHTAEVLRTADALITATGASQLTALGLDPDDWLERFRRMVLISALLHDLGKANDHFQSMIRGERGRDQPQGLRHETVSFLIARLPAIREWIEPALEGVLAADLVLWAVAGHHRKFPPDGPGMGSALRVYLEHDDFRKTLELGRGGFGLELGPPPRFRPGHELERLSLTVSGRLFPKLNHAREHADESMRSLPQDERRLLAAIKACLICADVAGSIGRRGEETMANWIPRAFARVPAPDEMQGIVETRLNHEPLRDFQETIAEGSGGLALVLAGCGTGKTVAAYARAGRRHPGRRVFFCYPTTGTATEGYRDYLADPGLEAELSHGRAEVDKAILDLHQAAVPADVQSPEIHDDEGIKMNGIAADSAGAMEQWSTPLVSCTVDTVLGLVQNNRRGLYAWPSIAGSFCVFDEVHAYDEKLFAALVRFLRDVPGVPCLLMTASLPDDRLRRLQDVMKDRGESTEPIHGPENLETVPRYSRASESTVDDAWRLVREASGRGDKVLWVVNTVNAAIELAEAPEAMGLSPKIYHSRFRYVDRLDRHGDVIRAFDPKETPGFALAITTQVAEMSLDLSADLLVMQLAPIAAMIQRLGRLNRRAEVDGTSGLRWFVVIEPPFPSPYEEDELKAARRWLDALGDGPLKQRDLVERWREIEIEAGDVARQEAEHSHIWLDGGFSTLPRSLREPGYGIDVILERDADDVKAGRRKPEEVRIPMPPPKGSQWKQWIPLAFCPVAPDDAIIYDKEKGARWKS